jgi:hypothetical protein
MKFQLLIDTKPQQAIYHISDDLNYLKVGLIDKEMQPASRG